MNGLGTVRDDNGRDDVEYHTNDVTIAKLHKEAEIGAIRSSVQINLEDDYEALDKTGFYPEEAKIEPAYAASIISNTIDEAIKLIDEVLEIYDDDITECINTFSLFEEKVKLLWENIEDTNENFKEVMINLIVAAKNSHYQKYNEIQYKSIKLVLEKIKKVVINKDRVEECLKLLKDSKIDLFAPIRNWENYKIEIKKIE